MKQIFIILLFLLSGCYTAPVIEEETPVSAMADWELQGEYSHLQIEQMQLEREVKYGGHTYTTTTTGYQPPILYSPAGGGFFGGLAQGMAAGIGNTTITTVHNPAIYQLNAVEERMRDIESEMTRRGILP